MVSVMMKFFWCCLCTLMLVGDLSGSDIEDIVDRCAPGEKGSAIRSEDVCYFRCAGVSTSIGSGSSIPSKDVCHFHYASVFWRDSDGWEDLSRLSVEKTMREVQHLWNAQLAVGGVEGFVDFFSREFRKNLPAGRAGKVQVFLHFDRELGYSQDSMDLLCACLSLASNVSWQTLQHILSDCFSAGELDPLAVERFDDRSGVTARGYVEDIFSKCCDVQGVKWPIDDVEAQRLAASEGIRGLIARVFVPAGLACNPLWSASIIYYFFKNGGIRLINYVVDPQHLGNYTDELAATAELGSRMFSARRYVLAQMQGPALFVRDLRSDIGQKDKAHLRIQQITQLGERIEDLVRSLRDARERMKRILFKVK